MNRDTDRGLARFPLFIALAGAVAGLALGLALAVGTAATPADVFALPALRLAVDLTGTLVVGSSAIGLLLPAESHSPARSTAGRAAAREVRHLGGRLTLAGSAAWALLALVLLWVQAGIASGEGLGIGLDRVSDYLDVVAAGRGLLVAAAAAVLCGVLVAVGERRELPPWMLPAVALLGITALPLTGHAAALEDHGLAVAVAALHAGAAAVWVGGLAVILLLVAPRRGLAAQVLPRFSRIAAWSLAIVAVSGLLSALIRIDPMPAGLLTTGYGWLVLAKTGVLMLLAAVGWTLRSRVVPSVARHQPGSLRRWATIELGLMTLAFGLAAVLAMV
ncbi:copper resistance D family protein [Actinoalloteichus hymeniacidonis]|uniref:Copper export protein n=1 Tax=Actinoalloteichus hymeniacidonis TaxID=340345 RepID=A0AAC9HKH0_9PSEU|nr:CopD family protein [Actinoalloteichus hymeniacidonis]AOS60895.1 putative copper export protein [Actinoalloteichus hymeniacidonis]MBB5911105.1 putative copper resistance protein D [Actinoalloteichus hymeniacidonis]